MSAGEQPGYFEDVDGTWAGYCCVGCFCPCVMTAYNSQKFQQKSGNEDIQYAPFCSGLIDLLLLNCGGVFAACWRGHIQNKLADAYNVPENGLATDYCCHCLCPCIALAQQGKLADGRVGGYEKVKAGIRLNAPQHLLMQRKVGK